MQSGRGADAAAAAEKLLTIEKTNEDLMTVVATTTSRPTISRSRHVRRAAGGDIEKQACAGGHRSRRLGETKAAKMARGYYIAGRAAYEQKKWNDADTNLRAVLPLAPDDKDLLAPTYFYLGFANHELARTAKVTARAAILADAKKFTKACADIKGPLQAPCQKNWRVAGGPMNILVPNLGSTSLKYQVLEMPAERVLKRGRMERVSNYAEAVRQLRAEAAGVEAVPSKAVHGGPRFRGTFRSTRKCCWRWSGSSTRRALHNAIYLEAIRAFQANGRGPAGGGLRNRVSPQHAAARAPCTACRASGASRMASSAMAFPRRIARVSSAGRAPGATRARERGLKLISLPPRREFVDMRDSRRRVAGYDDGLLGAIGARERDPQRRPGTSSRCWR